MLGKDLKSKKSPKNIHSTMDHSISSGLITHSKNFKMPFFESYFKFLSWGNYFHAYVPGFTPKHVDHHQSLTAITLQPSAYRDSQ